ncbi:ElyC/SanA/YdcF family protein [Enterococcus canintestini]|uniref:Uncharacterized protein n=1 Tax=Enterococcus canintestini TaxID=317010 RepID=A0A267HWB7_9ENTE|nr:ElyC/SanA/YdcF family protein [Enterococcus canintestini]PAB01793.1 hypothetical protein AKL21_02355 [Enterococcus canintestini]
MKETLADDLNLLSAFCGVRDLTDLSQNALYQKYQLKKADAFVLFGGSILSGIDVLITAMNNQVATNYLIVGGQGHTTNALRLKINQFYPQIPTKNASEAQMFNAILQLKTGKTADYLEEKSTNSGNNITNLLQLLETHELKKDGLILCQDATMQRRMAATCSKFAPNTTIINYASYKVKVMEKDNQLHFDRKLLGMWEMDQYITLLLGEISRLQNTPSGYGPAGKNFIAPVFIPQDVLAAFYRVAKLFPNKVRTANPAYAKSLEN